MQSVSWHLDLLYSIKEVVSTLKLKRITVGSLCNTSLGFHCAEGFPQKGTALWSILRYIFSKKTFTFFYIVFKERGHHRIKVRCAETLIFLFLRNGCFGHWFFFFLLSFFFLSFKSLRKQKQIYKRQHSYLQEFRGWSTYPLQFSICPLFPYLAKTMWVYRNISVYITTCDNFSICIVCIQLETFSMESSVIFY